MENKNMMTGQNGANELVWETEEFVHHSKPVLWYTAFTLVAAGLIIYAYYTKSIISIVTFALIIITAFVFSHKKPRMLTHALTPSGIVIGDVMYPYKNIKKFWILYDPPSVKTLNIQTTAYLNSQISIQLGDQDPVPVKLYLKKYLPEDLHREEDFTQIVARKLKF